PRPAAGPAAAKQAYPPEPGPLLRRFGRGDWRFRLPRDRRPHPWPGGVRRGRVSHRVLRGGNRPGAHPGRGPRPLHRHAERARRPRRAVTARPHRALDRDPVPRVHLADDAFRATDRAYAHVGSTIPILVLGFSIALIWQVAIPRGVLQGLQRFTSLSLNLSLELVVRTTAVILLLKAGYAVSGAMTAVF